MKNKKRTGDDLVERYCPRFDKNVIVQPNNGEKIGYTCTIAKTCDYKHCFMATNKISAEVSSEYLASKKQHGRGISAASTELSRFTT